MPYPFSTTSNPTLLYLTPSLHGTLEKIRFAVRERQGLCCVLGDVGLGKSSLIRFLASEYHDEPYIVTILPASSLKKGASQMAMLKKICADFGIPGKRSQTAQHEALEAWLAEQYAEGKTVILFIDEAQLMTADLLELIRAMLNFESYEHKLIQIIMAGQLELRDRILAKKNKALKSRIFAPCLLNTLTLEETVAMIDFRCQRAGTQTPFSRKAMERIYALTNGVPRDVLTLCAHAYNMLQIIQDPNQEISIIESAHQEAMVQAIGEEEQAEAAASL